MMIWRLVIAVAFALHPFPAAPHVQESGDISPPPPVPVVVGDSLVSFVSDTQSPLFFETLRIPANNNDSAREMIYGRLLVDRPNGIFHLGDMIAIGLYMPTWRSTDRFLNRASAAHVPVFPTLGNHELIFCPSYGLAQFYDRFPWYRKTGYAVQVGRLAVVLLNSNFHQLTDEEQKGQRSWLDSTLVAFESDTAVSAVILCCHHPPYTNSTVVSPSKEVRDSFVPLYLRYPKCRLFLSGHCHAFEHFREGGKDFFVIGGGGGLQQPLLTGTERRWEDFFPVKSETRMFHYLQCRIRGSALELTVRMVKGDFSDFEDAYTVSLPFVSSIH
jgi:3',5'-cyclic AMP phosphodiesterase CpdA